MRQICENFDKSYEENFEQNLKKIVHELEPKREI